MIVQREVGWPETYPSDDHRAMAALVLQAKVVDSCRDGLTTTLVELHEPQLQDGEPPACHGCDCGRPALLPHAAWPCRTYMVLAAAVLGIPDVEELLADLGRRIQGMRSI